MRPWRRCLWRCWVGDTQGHVFSMGFYTHTGWHCRKCSPFPAHQPREIGAWPVLPMVKLSAIHRQHPCSLAFILCPGSTENFPDTYFLSPRRAWRDGDVLRQMVHVPHHGRQRLPGTEETGAGREKTRLHPPNLPPTPNPPHWPAHGPRFPACLPQAFSAKCTVSFKKQSKTKPHTNI